MYCGKCGSQNLDSAMFCEKCGNQFLKEEIKSENKLPSINTSFLTKIFNLRNAAIVVLLIIAVAGGMFALDFIQAPEKLKRNVKFDISEFGIIYDGELVEIAKEPRILSYKDDFFAFLHDSNLYIQTTADESENEEIEGAVYYVMPKFNDKPEKVVYLDRNYDLYLYDIKSKNSEQIDSLISTGERFQIAISENSKYVAYAYNEAESKNVIYLYDGNNSREVPVKMKNSELLAVTNSGNLILTDWDQIYIVNEKEAKRLSKYDNFILRYLSSTDEMLFRSISYPQGYVLANKFDKAQNLKFSMEPLSIKYGLGKVIDDIKYYSQLNQLKKYWAMGNEILYYVNTKDDIKKIASTNDYKLSEDAKTVVYSTNSGLYRSDFKGSKPKRLYSGKVKEFVISKSANEAYIINYLDELIYVRNEEKPIELLFSTKKLAINRDDILFCLDHSGDLYYAKNGKLEENSLEYDVKDLSQSVYDNYVLYKQGDDVFVNQKGIEFK